MRCLISIVCVAITLLSAEAYKIQDNDETESTNENRWGWGWSCWWIFCSSTWCNNYNKETHVCCHETVRGCCQVGQLHALPSCSVGLTHQPDPCNAAKFYQCYSGNASHFSCPVRGVWNQEGRECVRVKTIYSSYIGRPFKPIELPGVYADYTITVTNGRENTTIVSFTDSAPKDSVYNVLAHLAGSRNDFFLKSTYHKRFWYSVECINGVCADYAADQTYWLFTINGIVSNLGVSSVIPNHNDVIGFEMVRG